MKNKLVKTISSLAMAAVLVCTSASAQAAEAADTGSADTLSIESCAANIKSIYKARYPEQADVVDEVVDVILSDEVFVGIFEDEGEAAFRIIEDALHDALDSYVAPIAFDEDHYYVDRALPSVQQIYNNYCGVASVVMALMAAGKENCFLSAGQIEKLQDKYAEELGITPNGTGVEIGNITAFMQQRFPVNSLGDTYRSKIFTRFSTEKIEDFLAFALMCDTTPIIQVKEPQRLSYYPNNYSSGGHYIVIDSLDLSTGIVWVIDPHWDNRYFGRHKISIEEIKDLASSTANLWMSVYTRIPDPADNHK